MNESRKSDMLELECLMHRNPKCVQRMLEHINNERARFTEMRVKILSTAIPSYIVKKGENPTMKTIYPESVTKALEEIDRMEEQYLKNNKFVRLYTEYYNQQNNKDYEQEINKGIEGCQQDAQGEEIPAQLRDSD